MDPDRGVPCTCAAFRRNGDAYVRICEIRIKDPGIKTENGSGSWRTYRALVRLLAGVATHMDELAKSG